MPTQVIDTQDARGTANLGVLHIGVEMATSTFQWLDYNELDPLHDRFTQLAEEWHGETGHLSSPQQIALHHAYQSIIGLGEPAIPLILADLKERGGQWYWALHAITNASPVPVDDAGNIAKMKEAWLRWGDARGHTT